MPGHTKFILAKWRFPIAGIAALLVAPGLAALPEGPHYYLYFLYVFLPGWVGAIVLGSLILAALETYKREHWTLSVVGGTAVGTVGSLDLGGGIVAAAPFAFAGAVTAFIFHAIVFWLLRPSATAP